MLRWGTGKRQVILILGIAVVLLCMVLGTWFAMRAFAEQSRQETQSKMRAQEAEFIEKSAPMLGKGGVLVSGTRLLEDGTGESPLVFGNQSAESRQTCSISWSVSDADYARIAEGMSLEEIRAILDLSALRYIPNGPQCEFTLLCDHKNRRVTLVFAGDPDVKLVRKSAE